VVLNDPLATPAQTPVNSPPRLPRKCYCGDLDEDSDV
jgi:hypothetical protein